MTYSFVCPAPCNREIKVDASDNLEAIKKIIMKGAISCRNIDNQCNCRQAHLHMSPIPEEQLRRYRELMHAERMRCIPFNIFFRSIF